MTHAARPPFSRGIRAAARRGGLLVVASFAIDGPRNLAGVTAQAFQHHAGTKFVYVTYPNIVNGLQDLVARRLQVGVFPVAISGDFVREGSLKALAVAGYTQLLRDRDAARARGLLAGIGISTCLEPSGGNSSFEPLLNEKNTTTTWMESCRVNVDAVGAVTATIHTTSSGQGHETLAATVIGETLDIGAFDCAIHAGSFQCFGGRNRHGGRVLPGRPAGPRAPKSGRPSRRPPCGGSGRPRPGPAARASRPRRSPATINLFERLDHAIRAEPLRLRRDDHRREFFRRLFAHDAIDLGDADPCAGRDVLRRASWLDRDLQRSRRGQA